MHAFKTCLSFVILGALFTLTGCGSTQRVRNIAPELEPYVLSFEQRFNVYYPGDVVFTDLPGNIVGRCWPGPSGWTKIEIDQDYFNSIGTFGAEELIYHELGHCAMWLGHNDNKFYISGTTCPVSIMNSYSFGDGWCYRNFRNDYLQQLEDAWRN